MCGPPDNGYGQDMNGHTGTPAERYRAMVEAGEIEADAAQRRVAARLTELHAALENRRFATKASALGWLFARHEKAHPLKGLYIHGAVGRGKTMLMDLFHDGAPAVSKRRVHFHEFMADVHERIHAWRTRPRRGAGGGGDPVAPVAEALAREARLLCFDEFHVRDIADAMILGRLFACLFRHGVVVVATSNDAPEDLYAGGLNRALFLPFVDLLRTRLDVLHLDARTDYRLEKLNGHAVYFHPLGAEARRAMDALWRSVAGPAGAAPGELRVRGRVIPVPAQAAGAARFSFADLCERPLGAADYVQLARAFPTVFLDDVPALGPERRNEARRFINLVDTLYDSRVRLIASAAAEPAALYPGGDGAEHFLRTASRLIEMRSHAYLETAGQQRPG